MVFAVRENDGHFTVLFPDTHANVKPSFFGHHHIEDAQVIMPFFVASSPSTPSLASLRSHHSRAFPGRPQYIAKILIVFYK